MTTDDTLELVRKSKLIEPAKLDAYLTTNPGPWATPGEFLNRLAADGLLTGFHVEQLARGKHRGYFLGRYKILERIGLGGMGQVFLAEHTSMRRRVALKVLPPDRAENRFDRERFLREARAAGQLDHPNIVRAFDVDEDGAVVFLVMEYVDGISLHELVARFGPVTPHRAAYFLWQAANGLGYIADAGLIHRDIKPANLLLDRLGVVKILDLGLVRSNVDDDELTRGQGVKILGTADFLSPEQAIDCSTVDVRADIYSLGATAYFLLTGKPPFVAEKITQKLIAHAMKPATPVREVRPDVPEALSAIIAKMLEKLPGDRFQSPAELVAALDPWAVSPPPPPTEDEIPASGGTGPASSAVNLSTNTLRAARAAGSSISLSAQSTSGSGLRFNVDSTLTPVIRQPLSATTPASGPFHLPKPTPASGPLRPSADGLRPIAPPAITPPSPGPMSSKVRDGLPPALPATATHGTAGRPPAAPTVMIPAPRPVPAPAVTTLPPPPPNRPWLAIAIALLVLAGVASVVAVQMSSGTAAAAAGK